MDQMEAELEAELTRLQLASNEDDEECATPRQDHQLLDAEAESEVASENQSPACVLQNGSAIIDDGAARSEHGREEDEDNEAEEEEERVACHTGVPARELERRLHELLQSRHEERIAELESELERARRKLREKEREVSRWRDTAKLVSRREDESRLR